MANRRMMVATLAGEAATLIVELFHGWQTAPDPVVIDTFCAAVREHGSALPSVYFTEWIDRWLMGDVLLGPHAVGGQRFQVSVFTPAEAVEWAGRCGKQWSEQKWFAARLREASKGWGHQTAYAVVVIRDVLNVSTTDEEVEVSLKAVPNWLAAFTAPANPR